MSKPWFGEVLCLSPRLLHFRFGSDEVNVHCNQFLNQHWLSGFNFPHIVHVHSIEMLLLPRPCQEAFNNVAFKRGVSEQTLEYLLSRMTSMWIMACAGSPLVKMTGVHGGQILNAPWKSLLLMGI